MLFGGQGERRETGPQALNVVKRLVAESFRLRNFFHFRKSLRRVERKNITVNEAPLAKFMDNYDIELIQSSWLSSKEMWRKAREVILEGVHKDGTFLDVGCANGVLLRDLCIWAEEKGINLIPFGIDISKKLVDECKERLPKFKMNFIVADRCKFKPKRKFTFICTSFDLRKNRAQEKYLKRYLGMLESGGRLILTRYDDHKDEFVLLGEYLKQMGQKLGFLFTGGAEVHEITKVFWLEKTMGDKTLLFKTKG